MTYASKFAGLWLVFLLAACVTINVYFPAAAAEKAADRIIEDVWGREIPTEPRDKGIEPEPKPEARPEVSIDPEISVRLTRLLGGLVRSAQAAEADIEISSPAINKIKDSMKRRHSTLVRYYDSGAAGLTTDGLVAIRDPRAVSLKERKLLSQLVAEDNRDRSALYLEIARANGHPEWESNIRATFARRWVSNARRGWWYQTASGWSQK